MKLQKTLKDLNLLDRFLFAEAADDPEFMELLLEIILGKDIVLTHLPQTEKESRGALWSKQVKLDVWAMDTDDTIYDTEVQNRNTKNLPKRTRLYHGLIDSKLLPPGTVDYNLLNEVFVIMIMPFDLFGHGRYKYTFKKMCMEIPDLPLEDETTTIFLNTRGTVTDGVSDELISLLKYFENTKSEVADKSTSKRILKMKEKIEAIRSNEEIGVKLMNAWEERIYDREDARKEGWEIGVREGRLRGMLEGKREGKLEGKLETQNQIISKMKQQLSDEEISNLTGIPLEEVKDVS